MAPLFIMTSFPLIYSAAVCVMNCYPTLKGKNANIIYKHIGTAFYPYAIPTDIIVSFTWIYCVVYVYDCSVCGSYYELKTTLLYVCFIWFYDWVFLITDHINYLNGTRKAQTPPTPYSLIQILSPEYDPDHHKYIMSYFHVGLLWAR